MKNKICGVLATLVAIGIIYMNIFELMHKETVDKERVITFVDSKIIVEENIEEKKEELEVEEATEENVTIQTGVSQNEVLVGRMSGYGPDCVGCTGYLAYNSIYVGNGTIYYDDYEYGRIRIVAGDRKYPFGTIVRINDTMNVIVLDRGGAIGIGKSFLFDLLYPSEYEANQNGILVDAKFEILRYGF